MGEERTEERKRKKEERKRRAGVSRWTINLLDPPS